jgi:hypothetical protein
MISVKKEEAGRGGEMNWKRGLLRFWALSSIIWAIFTVIFVSEDLDANVMTQRILLKSCG